MEQAKTTSGPWCVSARCPPQHGLTRGSLRPPLFPGAPVPAPAPPRLTRGALRSPPVPGARGCPPPPQPRTYQRRAVAGMRVVLDLPQALIEAFPLVGLPVLVFTLVVGKQVLGSQEGSGERKRRAGPYEPGHPGGTRWQEAASSGGHLRFVCTKEEDGVLVGRGLHSTVSDVIDL